MQPYQQLTRRRFLIADYRGALRLPVRRDRLQALVQLQDAIIQPAIISNSKEF